MRHGTARAGLRAVLSAGGRARWRRRRPLAALIPRPRVRQIKLGTVDQQHAENEFVLRSYVNSAKRSKLAAAEEEEGAR